MNNEILQKLKSAKRYLLLLTVLDDSKEEGNLTHYTDRQEFPTDDLVPSVDKCVRLLGIKPPQQVEVVRAPEIQEVRKPLKIAILTHFNRMPDSYSPGKAVKNQVKMLQQFGHEVVFFSQEGSQVDLGCEMRHLVPKFKREKNVINEEAKKKFIDVLREQLTSDFDLAITHDFYIDDCITYREAIRECGVPIRWLHWARSGVGHKIDFSMPNARYVYMNYADAGQFARAISVDPSLVRVVFNEKDPSIFFGWDPITKMISDRMRLWDKDIIQTYPVCSTRFDAKGINSVIWTFAALKRLGLKVALVVCNSNGRKRAEEIESKIKFAKECGLTEEDIVFTSTLANDEYPIHTEIPNRVVSQLFQISNLFVFPTIAEVCSNILLEASMSKNLLVLNRDLPSLFDFAKGADVLSHPFTSRQSVHYDQRGDDDFDRLAKKIWGQLASNKADRQMRTVWRTHNFDSIYNKLLKPILYEGDSTN